MKGGEDADQSFLGGEVCLRKQAAVIFFVMRHFEITGHDFLVGDRFDGRNELIEHRVMIA